MMENGRLNGKVAVVTGGTSGIGKTTTIAFARAGAKVVLSGRREKEGAQVVAEIKNLAAMQHSFEPRRSSIMPNKVRKLGGSFTFPDTLMTVHRMGYGAMQLAGPGVWGPPRDPDAAVAVLREAVAAGVNHIDTSDFYGPHVTNQIIRRALHPYPKELVIITKVGARRGADKSWIPALSRQELIDGVQDNLRNLDVQSLDVVNLRVGGIEKPSERSIAEALNVLVQLKRQGVIRHIGLSNVTPRQLPEAQTLTEIVCVQNLYNVAHRDDDKFIDDLARQGIAYVPFFPLGGFNPLHSATLDNVSESLGATPMQLALAWLLQRSPNILLIPGTSSVQHLRENLEAADLNLPSDALAKMDSIGAKTEQNVKEGI